METDTTYKAPDGDVYTVANKRVKMKSRKKSSLSTESLSGATLG